MVGLMWSRGRVTAGKVTVDAMKKLGAQVNGQVLEGEDGLELELGGLSHADEGVYAIAIALRVGE